MVEYGVYPSFVVTSAESTELYGTAQEPYYSTCFNDWEERIVSAYHFVASALDAVRGSRMIAHDCLKNGVIRVCYENGVQIYINYTDIPKQADGRTIEAGSYLVVEGSEAQMKQNVSSRRRRIRPLPQLNNRQRSVLAGSLFFLPWLIGFLAITLYPLVYSVQISFNQVAIRPGEIVLEPVGLPIFDRRFWKIPSFPPN